MAAIYDSFAKGLALKRKRTSGEADDFDNFDLQDCRIFKRSNLNQLPIRTSAATSQDRVWQHLGSGFQGPLTPVDSSDDEAYGQADDRQCHQRLGASPTERFSTYRVPSADIDLENMDDEMDLGLTFVPAKQTSTSPYRSLSLPTPPVPSEERMPTPMKATFGLFKDVPKTRGRPTTRHTILSPMMAEEPFVPSPTISDGMSNNVDPETRIRMERASSGFGALSVECEEDDDAMTGVDNNGYDTRARPQNITSSSSRRNAKLHMGFKADCEKCQQRVPGHYSHIVWS